MNAGQQTLQVAVLPCQPTPGFWLQSHWIMSSVFVENIKDKFPGKSGYESDVKDSEPRDDVRRMLSSGIGRAWR
ncbi:hypothetical protein E2C01_087688 [Portunus trituberculatus]|uniref:Uncharacterized protein n=1 Tax=Portunus trituberculatus TaxID=210409 RepID=A0A5B7J464_PORTR|nr:hypothetical protein [Portunus trituberculatus]